MTHPIYLIIDVLEKKKQQGHVAWDKELPYRKELGQGIATSSNNWSEQEKPEKWNSPGERGAGIFCFVNKFENGSRVLVSGETESQANSEYETDGYSWIAFTLEEFREIAWSKEVLEWAETEFFRAENHCTSELNKVVSPENFHASRAINY